MRRCPSTSPLFPYTTLFRSSVQPPPVVCRAFYVVDSSPKNLPFFVYQTEAMVISQRLRVPTINGYTGYYPQDWTLVNPKDPGRSEDTRLNSSHANISYAVFC